MSAGPAPESPDAAQPAPADERPVPASLAEWLAARSDDDLLSLLEGRPDVSVPPPADFDVLARRLTSSASVARALERVNRFGLEILEALALQGGRSCVEDLARASGVSAEQLTPDLDRLRRLGLLWGHEELHLPPGVASELGPHPLGYGRPAAELFSVELTPEERRTVAANLAIPTPNGARGHGTATALRDWFADPAGLAGLLGNLDDRERRLLDQLASGSPVGVTGVAVPVVPLDEAGTALTRLIGRGLLVPVGPDLVELPREVAAVLQERPADDLLAGRLHPDPPELRGPVLQTADVDAAAATAAAEFLRHLEALLGRWDEAPPVLTRAGGLPVRELRATAKALDLAVDVVALLAEMARGASLLAPSPGVESAVLPTEYFDEWQDLPAEQRWAAVASTWLAQDGFPGLATSVQPARPGPDGEAEPVKPLPVFSWDLRRSGAPAQRREVLDVLAAAPPGLAPEAGTVVARLAWQGPRRNDTWREAVATWTVREAELLGVTGRGALSSVGRALLTEGSPAAATTLGQLLPAPVDHLLIQGDLTAVAPGPLEPMLAREVMLVADVESAGAATVFRFSEASIRRALDAGWAGADVQDLIRRCARGTVPQSLLYLIDDVARRHGRLRVGSISSYVRCEDPALLAEVVAARRTASVSLRAVAPTVAVSPAPADRVLEALRSAGYAPAGEGADGMVRVERPPAERVPVPARRPAFSSVSYGQVPREHLASTVLRLRRAETAARSARDRLPRSATGEPVRAAGAILARLTNAVTAGHPLEMSYVNLEGRASVRVVHPLLLSGGYLTAYDEESGERRTFAVSRISSLVELADPG